MTRTVDATARSRRARQPHMPAILSAEVPLQQQLEEILEGLVARGRAGDLLPSERELAERFSVARMTARQAIEKLASKGLVYRLPGSGTFVAEAKFVQPSRLTSFTEDMRARDMMPGGRMIRQELQVAPDPVAGRLGLAPGSEVVLIQRVRTADNAPMAVESAYLPISLFPGLDRIDLADVSLYRLLEERWGVRVHSADQWVGTVGLDVAEAEILGVDAGSPALRFQRLTSDRRRTPIEYVVSLYRGDRYEVYNRLLRG